MLTILTYKSTVQSWHDDQLHVDDEFPILCWLFRPINLHPKCWGPSSLRPLGWGDGVASTFGERLRKSGGKSTEICREPWVSKENLEETTAFSPCLAKYSCIWFVFHGFQNPRISSIPFRLYAVYYRARVAKPLNLGDPFINSSSNHDIDNPILPGSLVHSS